MQQPLQAAASVSQDQYQCLRQSLSSAESEVIWRDLLKHTDICDSDIVEKLGEYTKYPIASALDLFIAAHGSNQEAFDAFEQHLEKGRSKNGKVSHASTVQANPRKNATKAPSIKTTVLKKISWVKDKSKTLFSHKSHVPKELGENQTIYQGLEGVTNVVEDKQSPQNTFYDDNRGIINPSFDLGIDNPTFTALTPNGIGSDGIHTSHTLEVSDKCPQVVISVPTEIREDSYEEDEDMKTIVPIQLSSNRDDDDDEDQETYLEMKAKLTNLVNSLSIDENDLVTCDGNHLEDSKERSFSTKSKDSGISLERNNSKEFALINEISEY